MVVITITLNNDLTHKLDNFDNHYIKQHATEFKLINTYVPLSIANWGFEVRLVEGGFFNRVLHN